MERVVAIYLRLSKADESGSIQNQRLLLERYVRQDEDLCSYETKIFIDDGFSGMEDNRPALQEMLSMVRQDSVYAVVVKDFSRLSRNHLYLAFLREKVLPVHAVELISPGDHYDSRRYGENDLALRFKSLFYEYYCRDISQKVKASLRAKKEKGEYAVARPPFGYRLEQGQWRIEEREAVLIQSMFEMAAKGYSNREISTRLEEKALPAKIYPVKVMRILENPVYCGMHVWHKYENHTGLHKKSIALPREQWRIEKGNHPAIISEELFHQVQKKRLT